MLERTPRQERLAKRLLVGCVVLLVATGVVVAFLDDGRSARPDAVAPVSTSSTTSARSAPDLDVGDCAVDHGTRDAPDLDAVPCESTVRGKLVLLDKVPVLPIYKSGTCDDVPEATHAYEINIHDRYGTWSEIWCMRAH